MLENPYLVVIPGISIILVFVINAFLKSAQGKSPLNLNLDDFGEYGIEIWKVGSSSSKNLQFLATPFDSLALKLRASPVTFWLLVAASMSLLSNILFVLHSASTDRILSMMLFSMTIGLTPLTIILCLGILSTWIRSLVQFVELPSSEVVKWFSNRMQRANSSRSFVTAGFVFSTVAIVAEYFAGLFDSLSLSAKVFAVVITFCSSFLCGMAVVYLIRFAGVVYAVGELPIKVTNHKFGVMSTGPMLVSQLGMITFLYLIYTSTSLVRFDQSAFPYLIGALPAGSIIVFLFFACQFGVHRSMRAFKQKKIIEIEKLLTAAEQQFYAKPREQSINRLSAIRNEYERILQLPEWPFKLTHLSTIFGYCVSTFIPPLIKYFVPSNFLAL